MKTPNTRGWAALLGAGVLVVGLAGCADRNNNGQPDDVATAGEVNRSTESAERSAENAGNRAGNAADNAADQTGAAIKDAGQQVDNAARNATQEASKAAGNALDKAAGAAHQAGDVAGNVGKAIGNALEPAAVTPNVKEAINDNARLKGTTIDVDTNGTTNTVVLKGTVKNNTQKQLAGQIAQREAKGYKISNTLKVQQ